MKKHTIVIAAVAALTMLSVSGTAAFAATTDTTEKSAADKKSPPCFAGMTEEQRESLRGTRLESLQDALESLVEDDVLTEDEAAAILARPAAEKSGFEGGAGNERLMGRHARLFEELSESQITAINTEVKSLYEDAIAELVDEGVLTEEAADQLFESRRRSIQSLDLTDEQREAVYEARQASMEQAINNVRSEGILSEEEAAMLQEKLSASPSEKEDRPQVTPAAGPFKDLTDEQVTAIRDTYQSFFEEAIEELLSDESITQEIADQVLKTGNFPGGKGIRHLNGQ